MFTYMRACVRMYVYITSAASRMWQNVIFKLVTTGLNSEFSFSKTRCHTQVKKPSLLSNLTPGKRE